MAGASVLESFNRWALITKSDTVNLDGSTYSATALPKAIPCEAIWVGAAGVVVAIMQDGTAVSFTCVAGTLLPVRAIRVNSGSTTADLMIAMYRS